MDQLQVSWTVRLAEEHEVPKLVGLWVDEWSVTRLDEIPRQEARWNELRRSGDVMVATNSQEEIGGFAVTGRRVVKGARGISTDESHVGEIAYLLAVVRRRGIGRLLEERALERLSTFCDQAEIEVEVSRDHEALQFWLALDWLEVEPMADGSKVRVLKKSLSHLRAGA